MRTCVHGRRSPARRLLSLLLILALLPVTGLLTVRNARAAYVSRFSATTNGAITFVGNTLGLGNQANANNPGTSDGIGCRRIFTVGTGEPISAAVITECTPGILSAGFVSIERIRPCAI